MTIPSDFRELETRLKDAGIVFLTLGPATDGKGWRANVRTDGTGWTTGDVHASLEAAVHDAIQKRLESMARGSVSESGSLLALMERNLDPLEGLLG